MAKGNHKGAELYFIEDGVIKVRLQYGGETDLADPAQLVGGEVVRLRGRSLMLLPNVGHHMFMDAGSLQKHNALWKAFQYQTLRFHKIADVHLHLP